MQKDLIHDVTYRLMLGSSSKMGVGYSEFLKTQEKITARQWDKMIMREQIAFVKEHGGRISPYRPGDGWKYVMEFGKFVVEYSNGGSKIGESSEGCILWAALSLSKKSGFDFMKLYREIEGSDAMSEMELSFWSDLTVVPSSPSAAIWGKILADLEDVNYHTLYSALSEAVMSILSKEASADEGKELLAWGNNPVMPRESYLPSNATLVPVEVPDVPGLLIYTYDSTDKDGNDINYGIAFYGKANKPIWHFRFRSDANRQSQIDETIRKYKALSVYRDERKKERQEFKHDLQVGDILYSSWGYDQTQVSWYQVVSIKDKSVGIREIGGKILDSNDSGSDKVVPEPDDFISPVMNKLVSPGGSVKINSFSRASKWDGKPKHETSLGWGH